MSSKDNLCVNFKSENSSKENDTYWDIVDDLMVTEEVNPEILAEAMDEEADEFIDDVFFQMNVQDDVTFH